MHNIIELLEQSSYEVFSEGTAAGNLATIFCHTGNTPFIPSVEDSSTFCGLATDNLTICYLNQTSQNPSITCFNQSGEIQRCGHGALAAAAYLDQNGLLHPGYTLGHKGGKYLLRKHMKRYWFSSDTFIEITAENFPIAEELVDADISETAASMGENGYLIIRLHDNTDLTEIQPNLALLQQCTTRALIITSAHTADPNVDYQIRYFAPQYGVLEDSATGSANEIAAHFWRKKLSGDEMCCYQASAAGGKIYVHDDDNRLWIGGRARRLD